MIASVKALGPEMEEELFGWCGNGSQCREPGLSPLLVRGLHTMRVQGHTISRVLRWSLGDGVAQRGGWVSPRAEPASSTGLGCWGGGLRPSGSWSSPRKPGELLEPGDPQGTPLDAAGKPGQELADCSTPAFHSSRARGDPGPAVP